MVEGPRRYLVRCTACRYESERTVPASNPTPPARLERSFRCGRCRKGAASGHVEVVCLTPCVIRPMQTSAGRLAAFLSERRRLAAEARRIPAPERLPARLRRYMRERMDVLARPRPLRPSAPPPSMLALMLLALALACLPVYFLVGVAEAAGHDQHVRRDAVIGHLASLSDGVCASQPRTFEHLETFGALPPGQDPSRVEAHCGG